MLLASCVWAQGPNNTGTYYSYANGKKGEALKTALYMIIKSPDVTSYDGLIEAYKKTDKRPDGCIRDWYSNATSYTWNDRNGNSAEGAGWNREHSVPQSWFSKASPMKSDIVHVVPTDCYVNGRRSSNPFGEVGTVSWSSKNGYSKVGKNKLSGYSGTVFEPNDEIKGDLARIYFYMVTCYEDRISGWDGGTARQVFDGNKYPGLTQWTLDMMMRWSKQDPIDAVEMARNEAVQQVQGNRNPFVDYPGLEEYVWGSKKDQAFSYDNYEGSGTVTVAEPIISPAGGTYYEPQTVAITCSSAGATIYYSTEQSAPWQTYSQPFTVSESMTVSAYAEKDGERSRVVTATFTITDKPGPGPNPDPNAVYYARITTADDLQEGDSYILVYEESSTLGRPMVSISNNRGNPTTADIENGLINTADMQEAPLVMTLEKSGNSWRFNCGDGYLAQTSKSNMLTTVTSSDDPDALWTVTPTAAETTMVCESFTDYSLRFNTSAKIFRCYTSGQQPVVLYRRQPTDGISQNASPGGTTGDVPTTDIYDLQGRRVKHTFHKGLFIVDGKKVMR